MKMKLYLINCSNLYLAFAALSDAEANTATYFYYCVSDLPNKLKDYIERYSYDDFPFSFDATSYFTHNEYSGLAIKRCLYFFLRLKNT